MPASLSTHLLEQHYAIHQSRAPFGQPFSPSQLALSGPMSYIPRMHVSSPLQQSFIDPSMASTSMSADSSSFHTTDISTSTLQSIAALQAKLDKKLGPEYISTRPGPGGGPKLTYAEGWKIINLANEVFGFNGWSSSVVNLNTDFVDFSEETKRWNVGVSAVIRVMLRDGVYHEDVGYGALENSKSKGAALDKCKKEAVTDGIKRALRNFGNLLGNCLYDKQYTQEIVKIKVPPAKFDKSMLHRRPEFKEGNSTTSNAPKAPIANATSSSSSINSGTKPANPIVIPKAIGINSHSNTSTSNPCGSKPASAVRAHIRPDARSTPARNASSTRTNAPTDVSLRPQGVSADAGAHRGLNTAEASNSSAAKLRHRQQQVDETQRAKSPPQPVLPQPHQEKGTCQNPHAVQEREGSETYLLDSDDDAFLAALDMEEQDTIYNDLMADMGRPIDDCEGIGSAIDCDEGPTDLEGTDNLSSSSGQKTLVDARLGDKSMVSPKVPQCGNDISSDARAFAAAATVVRALNFQPGQASPHAQRRIMQPRKIPTSNGPVARSAEDEIAKQVVELRHQRNAMRLQNAMLNSTGGTVDGNAVLKAGKSVPQLSSKPRTPSMGGFNFPSGMKPGVTPLNSTRQAQDATMHAGTKRAADTMNCVTASNGVQGIGSSYADAQAAAQARSPRRPFAPLDISDRGDPKRVRR